jgi:Bacterial TSP3 repeat
MIHGTYTKVGTEFFIAPQFTVHTDPVDQVYQRVMNGAGALPRHRDATDKRVIEGVRNQTGRIIKSQNEVGGWPRLESAAAPLDSDGDGIPDTWEIAHGLNPNDATDARKIAAEGSGYANIEVYLNSLVEK